ncbi:MAG: Rpn family recombination-promoting nuclease/putative transposase [Peptococcaceae bacterium]|nr:Rpn family recombination-promoting nuclease/putative transposase [Peptococcaceae bacterium]
MTANREYKDSVFSLYLSNPERLIDVYNAVARTEYPPDTPVEINTLTDVLYKNQINDLSFILDGQIVVLIEHQSTINENMALRLFLYSARVYEKLMKSNALYRKKRIPIPVPKFIVLYNGNERYPEHGVQKLSDSFVFQQENPQLELKIDIYNINYEVNAEIVRRSRSLNEYSRFIGRIRANLDDGLALEEAIKQAIAYGIEHDIMKEFLEAHGSEVANMLLSGWNMDEALAVSKEEGYEDGFEDGEKLGLEKGEKLGEQKKQRELILALKGVLSPEVIAEKFQVSLEYVMAVLSGASIVSEESVPYEAVKKE